ncbi:MAG: hypothetical protein AAF557_10315 [Pseudomonadota bacterium]
MTNIGDKVTLAAFLATVDERINADTCAALEAMQARLTEIKAALLTEPEILAQVDKLATTLPPDLAGSGFSERQTAARIATDLIEDLKERWIAAENPPLVDQIDKHFKELTLNLAQLQRPDRPRLRTIASQMDRLAMAGIALEGVEKRYMPWAIGALVLFAIGIVLFFSPSLLDQVPALKSFTTIFICLGALPAVGAHFAFTIRPRTQADKEIDALNKEHFLPHGGLYFPAGEHPASVVLIDWQPPEPEGPSHLDDPRKRRDPRDPAW